VNARWIFLLPLESHHFRTASGFTCLTVSLRRTWGIANPHRRLSVIVALHQVLRVRRVEKDLSYIHSGNKRYYIYILNSMKSPRLRDPLNRSTYTIEKTRTAPPRSKLMEWRCLEDKPRNLFDIYNFPNSASATFPREIYTHRTKIRGTLQSRK
jgi:hypothetical protein